MQTINGRFRAEVPSNPYASECPEGFDTVLGFLSKTQPGIFATIDEPVLATYRDNLWLTMQAHIRGIEVATVEAPEPAKLLGYVNVLAYPIALLKERLD